MDYRYVGVVTHYFNRLGVAAILLDDELYLEDWVLFNGPHTQFEQQVLSMQISREPVEQGMPGEEIAIQVDDVVRAGDEVYVIVD
ncbi:MAG: translation elongation factor-like protein [Anaerolineae bacterium]|nr:translation elongation factor-like protein [Anaerolineae bacterium]